MFNKIIKFLPLGSLIFIVLGFIKIKFYYMCFGIDISSFININDIMNLFLSDSIYLVVCFLGPIYVIIEKNVSNDEKEIDEISIREDEKLKIYRNVLNDLKKNSDILSKISDDISEFNVKEGSANKNKKHLYYNILITVIIIFLLIYLFNIEKNINIFNFITLLIFFLPYFAINTFNKTKFEIKKYYFEILFIFQLIVLFVSDINIEYFKVINNLKYKKVCIETLEETLQLNSDKIFIGNTEKYYFIKDLTNNENIIINSDQIKKIILLK